MTIQIGKSYTTRNGKTVTISDVDFSYSRPYFGLVKGLDSSDIEPASYSDSGMSLPYKTTEWDIISRAKNLEP